VTPAPRFEQALARAASIFDERGILYALIGGLAVAAWGVPRSTEDIDLLAQAARSDELDRALLAAGFAADWRRGGPDDPIPLLLRLGTASGPTIDVVCATRPWEREILARAVRVGLPDGAEVRVVAVDDLIVLKLLAGGPRDLADVVELLGVVGPLPELGARAAARGVGDLLRRVQASLPD
jgi:predicted nucleotidyltransferase